MTRTPSQSVLYWTVCALAGPILIGSLLTMVLCLAVVVGA